MFIYGFFIWKIELPGVLVPEMPRPALRLYNRFADFTFPGKNFVELVFILDFMEGDDPEIIMQIDLQVIDFHFSITLKMIWVSISSVSSFNSSFIS